MEGEKNDKPREKPTSRSDDDGTKKSTEVLSPLSPHGQAISESEKFEVLTDSEDAPTQEQSDSANCAIIPVQTRTHIFRKEVTCMQETVTSVLSKITSPPILRAATNDDILVGMIRDISGKVALLHEAVKRIERISAEKGQEQVTTKALEALIEQQRVTKEQTNKANDLLTELNAKKMEMEVLKMNLQKQEQDISKKVERIKELEQGQDAKRNELKTKVEGLENQINWMDAKIKFHEGQEEKIQKELSDKKAEVERLEERNAKVTEQWMEKSQKICEAMKLKDKEIAQVHREMGEVTEKENEIEKVKKHITIWHNNIQSLLESSNKIETIEADGLVGLQAAEEWKHSALSSLRTQLNEKELQINEKESKIKEQDGQIKQLKTERDSLNSECQAYKFATQTVGNYASATTDIASAHNKAMDILTKNTRKQLTIENNQTGGNNLAVVPISSPSIPPDLHHEVVKAESSSFSD